jgi:anaerobic ribonucleoside-triphosphate reductase activating protein
MSRDTWDKKNRSEVPLDDVVDWCVKCAEAGAEGITISGGEPFEQPAALDQLIARLDDWRREAGREFDILCYSGMPLTRLHRDFAHILSRLDALIPEPFQRRKPRGKSWQGSSNQPLILLSNLARRRFAEVPNGQQIQVGLADGKLFTIGIPDRGDMDRLAKGLRAKGIKLEDSSWLG